MHLPPERGLLVETGLGDGSDDGRVAGEEEVDEFQEHALLAGGGSRP
ncbi:hypothetical protein [Streptomyces lateritius]|nr:hypothetical protein [Streptomyces lateritius]MBX9421649.1 hypothetical protein [Streptomyces lateritius]